MVRVPARGAGVERDPPGAELAAGRPGRWRTMRRVDPKAAKPKEHDADE